jgi:hypothetical protein
MKCEIGPLLNNPQKLAIGKIEWRRTKNFKTRVNQEPIKRVCIDSEKYRTYNKPFFIYGLLFLGIFLILYFSYLIF